MTWKALLIFDLFLLMVSVGIEDDDYMSIEELEYEYPFESDTDTVEIRDYVNYQRLTRHVYPKKYTLIMTPFIEKGHFEGTVVIEIEVNMSINYVHMHQNLLKIDASLTSITKDSTGEMIKIKEVKNDTSSQRIMLSLDEDLIKGETYTIKFKKFIGSLLDANRGFYTSTYYDNGKKMKMALTQFQPTYARYAFPCFDEPWAKAKFAIFIVRPTNYSAVSNSKLVRSISINEDTEMDEFAITEYMSTYLVAFVISQMKLESKEGKLETLARSDVIDSGRDTYSTNLAKVVIKKIEEFVEEPYVLHKLTQAIVPYQSLQNQAMENWGLVIYREHAFVVDNTTTTEELQEVTLIVVHELCHQWFGNLVTPQWWNWVWLSEGISTYMEYLFINEIKPEWQIMDQMILLVTHAALLRDGKNATRPMTYEISLLSDVQYVFDKITYEKAAAVMHMLRSTVSPTVFKSGIATYLDQSQFSAAISEDLYECMDIALRRHFVRLGENIKLGEFMSSWELQAGFPLVYVSRGPHYNDTILVTQTRFFGFKTVERNPKNETWIIPINYASKSFPVFKKLEAQYWMTKKSHKFILRHLKRDDWVVVNKQQAYYYRVNYDEYNWKLLITALKTNHTDIHVLNRAQLLDDSFSLAKAGILKYSIPMSISTYLVNEIEYIPLKAFFSNLPFLDYMFYESPLYIKFQEYMLNLLDGASRHLSVKEKPQDSHLDKLNRVQVYKWNCKYRRPEWRAHAYGEFKKWMALNSSASTFSSDLEANILCCAMMQANQQEFDYLFETFVLSLEYDSFNLNILKALGCSENATILERFFNQSLAEDSNLPVTESLRMAISAGPFGARVAFDFISAHYNKIRDNMTLSNVHELVYYMSGKFTTQQQLRNLAKFAKQHRQVSIEGSIATVRENVFLRKEYFYDISMWMRQYKKSLGNVCKFNVLLLPILFVVSFLF